MSNPIKYSTGSESLALKTGNFYIGTGDVGKGPSDVTGYYQGPSVPSGGYIIYLYNSSQPGDLSYHTATNDTELISFTNSLAGASYTTANECLTYFAEQTDKMVLNRDYEGVVTDGLVFNVDGGFTPSYPKNGNTIYDTVQNNNGTFINGTSFDSSDGGCITFDGTNDYITFGSPQLGYTNDVTVSTWVMITGHGPYNYIALKYGGGRGWILNNVDGGVFRVDGRAGSNYRRVFSNVVPNLNQWYDFTFVKNDTTWMIYINGVFNASDTFAADTSIFSSSNFYISGYGQYSDTPLDGKISNFKIYNRALSSSEILHNYHVTKGRFGL